MTLLAYSVQQAVDATPLSRSALYRAMKSGELPYRKRGKRTYIMHDDLRRLLEEQPIGTPAGQGER